MSPNNSSSEKYVPANFPSPDSNPMDLEIVSKDKIFSGHQYIYRHFSRETKCPMKFSAYIPEPCPSSGGSELFPVLLFLSGVMCNEQNFLFKSAFQRYASENKIIVVGSDTSPRNCDIPGDRDCWVFGRSAGWYLDAAEDPWKTNYRMYSYVKNELVHTILKNLPTTGKLGICGHSMGGNGAVVLGLRNPDIFQAISLLAPSCNPTSWGDKLIYEPFLGSDKDKWRVYDAYNVAMEYEGPFRDILVDCGSEDEYLYLLLPDKLVEAAQAKENLSVELNMREGFNHSYYFVQSFIEDHIKFHAKALREPK